MKIAIAVIMGTIGGPRTYAYNLIKNILKIDKENTYFIFSDNVKALTDIKDAEKVQINLASSYTRIFWDHIKVHLNLKRYGIDVYHNTKNVIPIFCPCKSIVTIHDLAPFLFPDTFTRLQRIHLHFHIKKAAIKADKIITDSENSKKDIIEILGVNKIKVINIPCGVSDIFRKIDDNKVLEELRQKYHLQEKIILSVGTIQPRKNIDILIKAFNYLKKEKDISHQLVIAGRKGWLWKEIEKLVAELKLENEIHFTGLIPDEELPLLYNIADIFVSPSSYEGFGLTQLEAMACGTPVITSNVSSIPEVVGDAGIMIEPRNTEELSTAVHHLISDDSLKDELISKGLHRAKSFSWENTARKTIEIYKEVGE